MRPYYAYTITSSSSDFIYVGVTVNPKGRWKTHRGTAKRGAHQHLYRAMRLYGVDKFEMTIIATARSGPDVLELEKILIKQLKDEGHNLYNHTAGGNSTPDLPQLETCEKIRVKLKEIWSDPAKREKARQTMTEVLERPGVYEKLGKKGVGHWHAKLTEADVLSIRQSYRDGIIPSRLAEKYGVTRQAIWKIIDRVTWRHLQ